MTRPRTFRGNFDSKVTTSYNHAYGPPNVLSRTTQFFGLETGSFTSVKTPGFRNLKKSQLPINPHYADRELTLFGPSRYIEKSVAGAKYWTYWTNHKPNPGTPGNMCPYMDASFLSDLDNKLRLKIKNKKVDLAVMGGELRQTAGFLDKRVGGLFQLFNKRLIGQKIAAFARARYKTEVLNKNEKNLYFRRSPRSDPRRSASFKVTKVAYKKDINGKWVKNPYYTDKQHEQMSSHLSNTWLEYSYAVRPLLNDIYGAAEAIANVPYAVPLGIAKVSLKKNLDATIFYPSGSVLGNWKSSVVQETSREIGVRYYRKNPLSTMAALGLTNPLSLAWELVTLSFVIDWILPVGRTLDSLDATLGVEFLDGFQSTTHKASAEASLVFVNSSYDADSNVSFRRESFQRVRLTAFPGVRLPSFRWPDTLGQAASGVALLVQLFKR